MILNAYFKRKKGWKLMTIIHLKSLEKKQKNKYKKYVKEQKVEISEIKKNYI